MAGYNPAYRNIDLGKAEGRRFKKLGDIGEEIAGELLVNKGFTSVVNLNEVMNNFPFADYFAEKDDEQYLISVKTRNKFENTGKLNSRYKLGSKVYQLIDRIYSSEEFSKFHNTQPAWLAISMLSHSFSAYFGLIEDLDGSRAILMNEKHLENYICLALDEPHEYDASEFLNTYTLKIPNK